MTVGIPGAGIGTAFYMLHALVMPIREAIRAFRHHSAPRWRLVSVQFGVALGVVAGIALVGITLVWIVTALAPLLATYGVASGAMGGASRVPALLRISAVALMFAVLAAVLTAVQVLRLVVRVESTTHTPVP